MLIPYNTKAIKLYTPSFSYQREHVRGSMKCLNVVANSKSISIIVIVATESTSWQVFDPNLKTRLVWCVFRHHQEKRFFFLAHIFQWRFEMHS